MQLDLFQDSPRYLHEAVRHLHALEFTACRKALAEHCRMFPPGADAAEVATAVAWLEERVPTCGSPPRQFAKQALDLCRRLWVGDSPCAALAPARSGCRAVVRSLARQALLRMEEADATPPDVVREPLPWAVFFLWTGDLRAARDGLLRFLEGRDPAVEPYLALADACAGLGRTDEAARAYREGYGLAPAHDVWPVAAAWVRAVAGRYTGDALFPGDWWVVGAYLDGAFPRHLGADDRVLARRWRRFLDTADEPPQVRFYRGLFLSEQGVRLSLPQLTQVRKTLRELHPEGFALHMEQRAEQALQDAAPGQLTLVW